MSTPADPRSPGVALAKTDGLGQEIAPLVEVASNAVGELARARVQARAVVALQRPRDMDTVRVRLLKDCDRPGFAAVARYLLPRGGKKIVGPTIRFAEAARRALGNMEVFEEVVYEDQAKRILQVTAVDLETNNSESRPVVVDKVMERRQLRDGEVPIGIRTNSSGQTVYVVPVPESEMPVRQGAAVAKMRRNVILAHLPGDIAEECMAAIVATQQRDDKTDPAAARLKIIDGFSAIGITPDALKAYLGRDLDGMTGADIQELRGVYLAVKEGHATWSEILGEKTGKSDKGGASSAIDRAKEALAEKMAKKRPPTERQPGEEG